jgi:NADPH:quinone reductase-like Zn-dependent oxidoreductase
MPQQTTFRLPMKGAGYQTLQQGLEDIPEIKAHEVLLRLKAASLNFRDVAISKGTYPFPVKDDVVPCSDAAGIIEEIGSAVTDLHQGDWAIINFDPTNLYGPQKGKIHTIDNGVSLEIRVYSDVHIDWNNAFGGPIDGMLRQHIAVPANAIVPIPRDTELSWAQLAALVCTGTTAWNALYGCLPLKPGKTVLFQGTGGVSLTGLLLAKAAGATTIITSSSDNKLQMVREKYGVDHVINYRTNQDWADEASKITAGKGVDLIFENGGSGTIAQSIRCCARGGQIAVIGLMSPAREMPDVTRLVLGKGCIIRGINVGAKHLTEELVQFVCGHNLQMPVEKVFQFTLEDIIAAYKYIESGVHIGKVCIQIC